MKQPEQTKEEKTVMTLEEAKRVIAIKHSVDTYNLTVWMADESAELYASQKCKALQEENERLKDLLTQTKQHVIPSYCELREKIHKAVTGSQSKD